MSRRFAGLLVGVLAAAAALSVWGGRLPVERPSGVARSGATRILPIVLRIQPDGHVTPSSVTLPLGTRVDLTVTSAAAKALRVELPGYQDRVPGFTLEPGATFRRAFLADRPGDDFALLVDGSPAARLDVAGSHLIEGHR